MTVNTRPTNDMMVAVAGDWVLTEGSAGKKGPSLTGGGAKELSYFNLKAVILPAMVCLTLHSKELRARSRQCQQTATKVSWFNIGCRNGFASPRNGASGLVKSHPPLPPFPANLIE